MLRFGVLSLSPLLFAWTFLVLESAKYEKQNDLALTSGLLFSSFHCYSAPTLLVLEGSLHSNCGMAAARSAFELPADFPKETHGLMCRRRSIVSARWVGVIHWRPIFILPLSDPRVVDARSRESRNLLSVLLIHQHTGEGKSYCSYVHNDRQVDCPALESRTRSWSRSEQIRLRRQQTARGEIVL